MFIFPFLDDFTYSCYFIAQFFQIMTKQTKGDITVSYTSQNSENSNASQNSSSDNEKQMDNEYIYK